MTYMSAISYSYSNLVQISVYPLGFELDPLKFSGVWNISKTQHSSLTSSVSGISFFPLSIFLGPFSSFFMNRIQSLQENSTALLLLSSVLTGKTEQT